MAQRSAKGEVAQEARLKHIEQWKQSGLEKGEYCQQHSITKNQLAYWQKQLERPGGRRGRRPKAVFARVAVEKPAATLPPARATAARLVVGGGAVLEIDGSVDPRGRPGSLPSSGAAMKSIRDFGSILLHKAPVDGRKQINGLAAIVLGAMGYSPFGDALFVFTTRRRDYVKLLYWNKSGFALSTATCSSTAAASAI